MSAPPVLRFEPAPDAVAVDLEQLIASRMLIQANSGGGKSYLLRYTLEQTAGRVQQVVFDWEGEFASLRERFEYLLAGDEEADVPAHPKAAKTLARRVMELGPSLIVDLYHLSVEDRRLFVKLFLEELMHLPRALWRPLIVAIDEAHRLCPERGAGEAVSTGAVISLCSEGRKRGFCPILATQRLSKLHKDAAAELTNVFIGRTGLDVDVKRAGDILGFEKERRLELPRLEPGEWFAFGPAVSREVVKVVAGEIQTTHPRPGEVIPPPPPPRGAITALVATLADLPKQAEEEARTLEEANSRIARLQTELRRARKDAPAADPDEISRIVEESVETAVDLSRGFIAAVLESVPVTLRDRAQTLRGVIEDLERAAATVSELIDEPSRLPSADQVLGILTPPLSTPAVAPREDATPARRRTAPRPAAEPVPPAPAAPNGAAPSDTVQRILDEIAAWEVIGVASLDRRNLAVQVGYAPTTKAYTGAIAAAKGAGLIWYPDSGHVALTEAGRARAIRHLAPPELADLHDQWRSKLGDVERRVFDTLLEAYPGALAREELAAAVGYATTTKAFTGAIGFMGSIGLVRSGGGAVVLSDLVFPPGLS